MTLVIDCIACQMGNHDQHVKEVFGAIPGLIGAGHQCMCKGECVDKDIIFYRFVDYYTTLSRSLKTEGHIERGYN